MIMIVLFALAMIPDPCILTSLVTYELDLYLRKNYDELYKYYSSLLFKYHSSII
jgi:hypothetical protein